MKTAWLSALALEFLGLAAAFPVLAQVRVEIASPDFHYQYDLPVKAAPGEWNWGALPGPLSSGDQVQVLVTEQQQSGEAYDIEFALNGAPPAEGTQLPLPARKSFTAPQDGQYVIWFRNGNWVSDRDLTVTTEITRHMTPKELVGIRTRFASLADEVRAMFPMQSFAIKIAPLGQREAYYDPTTGDIVFSTELIGQTLDGGNVLDAILFHEFGHKILHDSQLPNWDTEPVADSFAVYLLLERPGGIGMAADFSTFFRVNERPEDYWWAERGDQHPLGAQRFASIQTTLRAPEEFMRNWNNSLYPYMDTRFLSRIAVTPHNFESPILAGQIVNARAH